VFCFVLFFSDTVRFVFINTETTKIFLSNRWLICASEKEEGLKRLQRENNPRNTGVAQGVEIDGYRRSLIRFLLKSQREFSLARVSDASRRVISLAESS
jgi:hypothetical protein